jgi:hypothetical protein
MYSDFPNDVYAREEIALSNCDNWFSNAGPLASPQSQCTPSVAVRYGHLTKTTADPAQNGGQLTVLDAPLSAAKHRRQCQNRAA